MRITLIHNPEAGNGSLPANELRECLVGEGYRADYHSTKKQGWKRALRRPCDLVVAAGGDGTIAKVARRIAGRGVPLAILPAGTANNIGRALGLVADGKADVAGLIAGWRSARLDPIDMGLVSAPWGERLFIEAVGLGIVPGLIADSAKSPAGEVPRRVEVARSAARLSELAAHEPTLRCDVAVDGRDVAGDYLLLEVMNIPSIGPRARFAPAANPRDGLLEVVAAGESHRRKVAAVGGNRGGADGAAGLLLDRGRHIKISSPRTALHVDDKLWPDPDEAREHPRVFLIEVTALPGAIDILTNVTAR